MEKTEKRCGNCANCMRCGKQADEMGCFWYIEPCDAFSERLFHVLSNHYKSKHKMCKGTELNEAIFTQYQKGKMPTMFIFLKMINECAVKLTNREVLFILGRDASKKTWIECRQGQETVYKCFSCRTIHKDKTPYCPHCGSWMIMDKGHYKPMFLKGEKNESL